MSWKGQGRFDEAQGAGEEALAVARNASGRDFPELANVMHNLAEIKNDQSKYDEGESLALQAVEMHRRLQGAGHPETAWSLLSLGIARRGKKELTGAEAALREALVIFRKYYSSGHKSVDQTVDELNAVLEARGDFAAAEALQREVLAGQSVASGDHGPVLAESLGRLAASLYGQGKQSQAAAAAHEAAEKYHAALSQYENLAADPNRPRECWSFAISYEALAQILWQVGQPQEAEKALRDTQGLWQKLLAESNTEDYRFHLAVNRDGLGIMLRETGRGAESLAAFQEAQAIWLKLVAEFDQEDRRMHLGQTDDAISNLLMAFNRFDEAAEIARQALAVWKKLAVDFNNNSCRERAALATEQLARLLHEQGKDAEAETLERELAESPSSQTLNQLAWRLATAPEAKLRGGSNAVSYAERAVAQTDRKHVGYLDTLAAAYAETGQFAKAISVQKEALALSQNVQEKQDLASKLKLYENNSPYRDHGSLAELTRTRLAEGKFADAEPLARECLTLREIEIPDDWRTFNARSMVGDALLGQKKYAEAEPLLLAAYEGMKQREDKIPAAGKLRVKETLQRLVQLYEATGPTDRAAKWKRKLAEFDQAESEQKNIAPKP